MSANQWTIEDFQSQRPVFRVSMTAIALLVLALAPFAIGAVYWLYCVAVKPYFENPQAAMLGSVFVGGLFAATGAIVTVEWLQDYHYSRLRRRHDVIGRCETLLREALADEAFLEERYGPMRPSMIDRLQQVAAQTTGRIEVNEVDQPRVLAMIEAWAAASANTEEESLHDARMQSG